MISIVSDSTCDLSGEECAALGIDRVPLTVQFFTRPSLKVSA